MKIIVQRMAWLYLVTQRIGKVEGTKEKSIGTHYWYEFR